MIFEKIGSAGKDKIVTETYELSRSIRMTLYNLYLATKIQQTKMLVTSQRFGDLFLFGLVWQYSSNHKTYNKGRFKVIATYLQQ